MPTPRQGAILGSRWGPAALFAGGAPGLWLDPSDLSSMYQDSAGTTAAAIDSPVGKILDKSGNGNHAVQATSGKRPILRAGGYLDFTSANSSCLQVASCALPTFIYLAVGFQQTNANPLFIEHSADASANEGFWFYGSSSSTWLVRRSVVTHLAAGTTNWAGTVPVVGEFTYNGIGSYWKNGVVQSNGSVSGTARGDTVVTAALNIGSRNQASVFLQGSLYGLIVAPAAAASMQAQARAYMGSKTGLSL